MSFPGSLAPDERLRLFLALRLPDDALDEIVAWQGPAFAGAPVRVVPREHLHATLAFLGLRPAAELPSIVEALREAALGAAAGRLRIDRYRETRSVAMLVLEDLDGAATAFAEDVQSRLEALGVYRRENRAWLAHVTVARFRERPRLRLEPPRMGTGVLIPSDAAAYLSRLRPGGAEYVVLDSVLLGGR
jgi:RNA 2',3'-cyclic 3'-phosphodiesterase